jgi:hypothetical protein
MTPNLAGSFHQNYPYVIPETKAFGHGITRILFSSKGLSIWGVAEVVPRRGLDPII